MTLLLSNLFTFQSIYFSESKHAVFVQSAGCEKYVSMFMGRGTEQEKATGQIHLLYHHPFKSNIRRFNNFIKTNLGIAKKKALLPHESLKCSHICQSELVRLFEYGL